LIVILVVNILYRHLISLCQQLNGHFSGNHWLYMANSLYISAYSIVSSTIIQFFQGLILSWPYYSTSFDLSMFLHVLS
jgi:hypothetical protein